MQRLPQNLQKLSSALNTANYSNLATIRVKRWCRKPWNQTAKSKVFRVPKRPVVPTEEQIEMRRLFNNYRTHVKSLRAYLEEKYCVSNLKTSDPEEIKRLFEEDFERCRKINDEWNEQQRVVREKEAAERLASEMELVVKKLEEHEEEMKLKMEEIEELVRQEKEKSKTFILDLEALDAAIEQALANPTDHNFAIDLEGNKIYGRESGQPTKEAVKQ